MKKTFVFLVLCLCIFSAAQAQVANFDTIHLKKSYVNDIFSTLYSANFRSGLVLQSGGSLNNALNGPSGNGFRFRWLANDTLVNYQNDNDLIMTLLPKGDLIIKRSLNVPDLTVGSFTDTSYKKLVIAGANLPMNANSRRDLSFEFSSAGKAAVRAYRGGSWDTYLQFLTNATDNTGGEPVVNMHINQDGNIGMGTVTPLHHLQIDEATANTINMVSMQNTAIANSRLLMGNTSANYAVVEQRNANVVESYTDLHVGAANSGNIYFETGRINTVVPIRMTILNNGNVGIGTTTTGTNKLAVEGTIAARRVKVTQSNPWPDYVFHERYQLPLLNDVAAYVTEHKHLPGIPGAAEVAKEGQDLGEMNRKLLEKVEELTLYIIQQNKRNDEQQAQIDMLIKQLKK
ncbi:MULTISPECIES: hypothetical protein [unclassified Chitinophaga]|uniref:hypothetical protein n=1 Tax=unclassified Chitinophaga TaxID=2619133 RepID=UPI0030103B42